MTMQKTEILAQNVSAVRKRMINACLAAGRDPKDVLLCAASKMQDADTVRAAAGLDIDIFGENRVQELCQKQDAHAYADTPLHFIGHLQTNKVKQVVGRALLIESVGSEHLMRCIAAEAEKKGLCQDILIEINIGKEISKSGIAPEELDVMLKLAAALPSVRVRGLMAIPPVSEAPGANRPYFARMRCLFDDIRSRGSEHIQMDYLSMGMSGDFEDAILEGANIVRVGTAIFGARDYSRK